MISAPSAFTTANLALVKQPIYLLEIQDLAQAFVNRFTGIAHQCVWIEENNIEDFSTTISETDGGADLGEFAFTVIDKSGFITSLFPTFVFEGKRITLKTGFLGMSQADFCLLFTGEIDHVDSVNSNTAYRFSCVDNKQKLNQVIYTTGDDGLPTGNDHRLMLNGHPLDLMTDIFDSLGLNYDSARIAAYRDGVFSGTQFIFSIDSPPAAKDFIENELLKPLAGYLWTNNEGKLSVNFIYPLTLDSVHDFDESEIAEIPEAQQIDLINVVNYRYDQDNDQNKFMIEVVQQFASSIAKYGQYGQRVIESNGMRSSLQGYFLSAISSRMLFQRYGQKALKFNPLHAFWTAVVIEPGDIVTVTHANVPDRAAGVMGIASNKFAVMDRLWSFKTCTVQLLLLDAKYLNNFGFAKITPDGEADYASASSADKAKYMFLCNDSDQYSNGHAAQILG